MYAIEFKSPIQEGGFLKIPEHYLPQLNGNVKVIIFTEEPTTSPDIIDRLMESPLPMSEGKPLSREEIYEPRI
ncbi:MAG: hypothetical protein DRR16_30700 [Candidatus Parabeggiatoa sp. nov. 3]|nr:MAG: hypothetical protein DRR00_22205 [Gammaproteobacteria bacterium]RKZ62266.1 MAG: hypothetical protein DRQ99_19095 [Gammaproteobacteria bacterium]RKZ76095.1 MAG: hypothetical protein DRR16_30700 [Gammaproteobacteria bacterium]HEW98287.1 hypothetical protein [Beggiatoa sp.]